MEDLISLKEYAAMHGISDATLRQRIGRGLIPEARKIAGAWFVPRDLPHIDHRKGDGEEQARAEAARAAGRRRDVAELAARLDEINRAAAHAAGGNIADYIAARRKALQEALEQR